MAIIKQYRNPWTKTFSKLARTRLPVILGILRDLEVAQGELTPQSFIIDPAHHPLSLPKTFLLHTSRKKDLALASTHSSTEQQYHLASPHKNLANNISFISSNLIKLHGVDAGLLQIQKNTFE